MRIETKRLASGASGLARLEQSGSARLLTEQRGPGVSGVILNTSGGITGGDRLRIEAEAGTGARLRLTTQAAERIYRSGDGTAGTVETTLTAASGARLDWLPQETLVFDGGHLRRRLTAHVARDARMLIVEPMLFGRLSMGETVRAATVRDSVTVVRGGAAVLRDATCLTDDIARTLDRPGVAAGARAMALLILAAPEAEARLDPLRALLPETAGASLVGPDLLVMRLLAPDGFALRQTLVPVLDLLTDNTLPRSWRL